jgi:hypothetical protein
MTDASRFQQSPISTTEGLQRPVRCTYEEGTFTLEEVPNSCLLAHFNELSRTEHHEAGHAVVS